MGRMTQSVKDAVLHAYFEEEQEPASIALTLGVTRKQVCTVLSDTQQLEPYQKRSEAAKLRAQICVNENAEEAARRQASLLRSEESVSAVSQRAAKDILDRAGVRVPKESRKDICITFAGGMPTLGMPRGTQETRQDKHEGKEE